MLANLATLNILQQKITSLTDSDRLQKSAQTKQVIRCTTFYQKIRKENP
jgi:hypothetical protein